MVIWERVYLTPCLPLYQLLLERILAVLQRSMNCSNCLHPAQGLRMNVETLFRQTVLTLNLNNC